MDKLSTVLLCSRGRLREAGSWNVDSFNCHVPAASCPEIPERHHPQPIELRAETTFSQAPPSNPVSTHAELARAYPWHSQLANHFSEGYSWPRGRRVEGRDVHKQGLSHANKATCARACKDIYFTAFCLLTCGDVTVWFAQWTRHPSPTTASHQIDLSGNGRVLKPSTM